MSKKKKIIISSIVMLIIFISLSFGVYAIMASTSTRSKFKVSSDTITATSTYTSSTSSFDLSFNSAGDYKQISIITQNSTQTVLHNKYQITSEASSDIFKAILVYLNDDYIGILNNLIAGTGYIEEEYGFIPLATSETDVFKFELHQSAIASGLNLEGANALSVTINTYTENADYLNFMYVKTDSDFKKAIDDANSGVYSEAPIIVLCGNVTLSTSYTITNPTTIYLNGHTLTSGTLLINDTDEENPDALLKVVGDGTLASTITLGDYYDTTGADTLVKENAKKVLEEGLKSGRSVNLLGYYTFYKTTITAVSNCTYTKPSLSATTSSYTKVGSVTVDGETIQFKVRGSEAALIATTLNYLPTSNSIITSDLFLPTYIPSQNATITWTSSKENIISSNGKIAATKIENEEVSLYAEIKVNDTVYTEQYDFKVAAHTNEINFYKLVQEISPVVISNVYSNDNADEALYHLPIVSKNANGTFNDYDYRTSYKSPTTTQLFDWVSFKDIGLESIVYSMSNEQQTAYDYITLANNNELYLNSNTLNNYARITVTGNFGNDETYQTYVNISISVGSNTQLLEKAFAQISDELSTINVLGNIIKTRIESGMANEKGDFSLNSEFADESDYSIEYSGANGAIHSISLNANTNMYDFKINPEYFKEYETTVAFTATVWYKKGQTGATSKQRTFYITVPAALHIDDFGTISLYNSTKYQVFNSLPEAEKQNTSGYNLSGTTLTDSNYDYILLRDIVGDNQYISEYAHSNDSYLDYFATQATGVTQLCYYTDDTNKTSNTDTAAYDFVKLIEWATSSTRVTASTVVSNATAISSVSSKKSNGEAYLNDDEISVIKACYKYYTGATDSDWDEIQSEVLSTAPGYIFTDSSLLNQIISSLGAQSIASSFSTLFGKYMEVLQRYAVSTTTVNDNGRCIAPCQDQYNGTITWYHSTEANLSSFELKSKDDTVYTITVDGFISSKKGEYWYYHTNLQGEFNTSYGYNYDYRKRGPDYDGGGDGNEGGFYATKYFESDKTSYITDPELQVILMFWLNNMGRTTTFNNTQQSLINSELSKGQAKGYYSGYASSDFASSGQALINAFYACLEVPTSFTTDGISKLIKYFYNNYSYNNVTYSLKSYASNNNKTFVSSMKNNVPTVTNLDNIGSAISYFSELTVLSIKGNTNLSVFQSEYGLSTTFTRASLNNNKIATLEMNYLANTSVNFDLTNVKNFSSLRVIDFSNNKCIQSTNELINVNRSNYTHVDIQNIGVDFEYQEFAIDNLASPTCTVVYTNLNNNRAVSNDNSNASCLANLSDFDEFITKYFYETNVVYDDEGNAQEVYWRIEEGNSITGVSLGGSYPELSTISDMNKYLSPYFYCKQTFTYNNETLTAGYLYKLYVVNDTIVLNIVGQYETTNSLDSIDDNVDVPSADFSDYSPTVNHTETKTVSTAGTITYQSNTTFYTESSINNYVTISFNYAYYLRNQAQTNYYMTYGNFMYNGEYLGGGDGLCTTYSANTYFVFLTLNEATNLINKTYTQSTSVGASYNTVEDNSNTYYMAFVYDNEIYLVGSTDDEYNTNDKTISVTRDITKALKITLIYKNYVNIGSWYNPNYKYYYRFMLSTNHSIRINAAKRVTYHSQDAGNNWWRIEGTGSTQMQYQYVYNPSVTVRYYDGRTETINAYAAGYRFKKTDGTDFTVTETETTEFDYYIPDDSVHYYYYSGQDTVVTGIDGSNITIKHNSVVAVSPTYIYPVVSRSRQYRVVGTIYEWEFWYCTYEWEYTNYINGNGNVTGTIDGSLIRQIKVNTNTNSNTYSSQTIEAALPANSITVTQLQPWDDWNDNLESEWVYDKAYCLPYISYVEEITGSSTSAIDTKKAVYSAIQNNYSYIYKYTGTTNSEKVYYESIEGIDTSYTNNDFYKAIINADGYLEWEYNSSSLTNDIADDENDTMDSILAEANTHFKDYQYGSYYGMYYAYSGDSKYISSGIYLKQYYVYRIMPNSSNTAFEWVEVKKYTVDTSSNILLAMGTNQAEVGDIFLSTQQVFDHFHPDYYRIVLDGKTNIVNLVRFNDILISYKNDDHSVTGLTNAKTKKISDKDYLGYSGTFTAEISAVYRVYDSNNNIVKEYVKKYKIKLVGYLT